VEQLTIETAIIDLKKQRCEYTKMVADGNQLAQASVDFIDNVLAQLVPGYLPNQNRCSCKDT